MTGILDGRYLRPAVWKGQRVSVVSHQGRVQETPGGRIQIRTADGSYRMVHHTEIHFGGAEIKPKPLVPDTRGDSTPSDAQDVCEAAKDGTGSDT